MTVRSIFVGADGRLRSGWAIAIFLVVVVALTSALAAILYALAQPAAGPQFAWLALSRSLSVAVLVVATWVGCLAVRQPLSAAFFADPHPVRRVGAGLAGAAVLFSAVAVVTWTAGQVRFRLPEGPASAVLGSMAAQIAVLVPAGAAEELLLRGFVLQQLVRGVGRVAAVGITSVVFSLIHFANPEVGPVALLNITLVGVLFGVLTLRSGSLWAATGLHIGWNVMEGPVWGFPISGLDFGRSLLQPHGFGDPRWTGGAFGPEAGLPATVWLLIGIVVVGRFVRPAPATTSAAAAK